MSIGKPLLAMAALATLSACTTVPTGPSVMTLPGSTKSFEQFRADEADCRLFAQAQIGGATTQQAANQAGVQSAAVGTVVGAAAGAALGGHNGAAAGAGAGLLMGTMAGTAAAQETGYGTQRQYDNAFIQCMYARGHKVPVSGAMARSMQAPASAAPTTAAPLPPPAGKQPPPAQDRIRP